MPSQTFSSSGTWSVPVDVTSVQVQAWGEGGNGGTGVDGGTNQGACGGGGGEFAQQTVTVTPGVGVLAITIGTGGTGTATTVTGGSATVTAHMGGNGGGPGGSGGAGGTGSTNTIHHDGGPGGADVSAQSGGAGGGGGAGSTGNGGAGSAGSGPNGGTAGAAGTGTGGGTGGTGGGQTLPGAGGTVPGGGGGGGSGINTGGGAGAHGQVILTWSLVDGPAGYAGGTAKTTGISGRIGGYKGYAGGWLSAPKVVNAWAADFAQPTAGPMPPGLQSVVLPLTAATSVGTGTGVPSQGTWLFALVGWQQSPQQPVVTFGVGDDIHSWWRPGTPSLVSGNTRTVIWYTPNTARQPGYVYVPPSAVPAGVSVLVVEVAGLGSWDSVVNGIPQAAGYTTNYAAAATSLSLSLPAPAQYSFAIGAVTGGTNAASQAFAPSGWVTLPTVTATDGSDHLCDAVLTSAWTDTSGSISVSGTTSSSSDLSGALLLVYASAPSPIPASQNTAWPYLKFEAGFGAGFQTPLEQITWTDLTSRLLKWEEITGLQYQLGQIQSTDLSYELDNYDLNLSPLNTSSPYYPNIVTGTPIRVRAAIGVMGGVTVNRWYVIHRNIMEWQEEITDILRPVIQGTGTDGWFGMSSITNTPYRNEVVADKPYAWWPCDDQPLAYGVLPSALLNNANGNANPLTIQPSPNGITAQGVYSTTGTALGAFVTSWTDPQQGVTLPDSIPVYTVGADQGWMFGDPQSLFNNNTVTGGQATSNPGSAAWQTAGQTGTTGSYGWFLYGNDNNFPSIASGVTVEGWFNYGFLGSAAGVENNVNTYDAAAQPVAALTLFELAFTQVSAGVGTTGPVAVLQLGTTGHLSLITYNGTTPTTTAVYSTSDLRASTWFHVALEITAATYKVYVNGGLTATVSGSATINANWNWLIVNGDLGTNGGSAAGTGLVHGGNVAVSHLAIYPSLLPAWRILAHYWAAIAGNGLLPAPQSVQLQSVSPSPYARGSTAVQAVTYSPDGGVAGGSYGGTGVGQNVAFYGLSFVAVAFAGSYNSGPSGWTTITGAGTYLADGGAGGGFTSGQGVYASWTGVAPKVGVYTASQVNAEKQAEVVLSNSESFGSGYGSSATTFSPGNVAAGSNASPPASASAIGDTVGQRLERIVQQGLYTVPLRCIDTASQLVQAPGPLGAGLQAGEYLQAIQQSDDGMLFIDNTGMLTYWQRPHLAAQYSSPAWTLSPQAPPTPGASLSVIPYYREIRWITDPHRVWDVITIQPFSPGGAQLPFVTPANSSGVLAAQTQYAPQPLQIVSWLQSQSEMQNQANFLFTNYGQPQRRAENVEVDAASYPAAWPLIIGANIGDIVTVQDFQIGGGGSTYTYRLTRIRRTLSFGARGNEIRGGISLQLDYEPTSYWS